MSWDEGEVVVVDDDVDVEYTVHHKGKKAGLAIKAAEKEAKLGGLLLPRVVHTW